MGCSPGSLIPVESVENITSFLWCDLITLSNCALVCHRWYTAVRPLLFRRVVIKSPTRLAELEALVLEHPAIAYWIRELHFDGSLLDQSHRRSWMFSSISVSHEQRASDVGTASSTDDSDLDLLPGIILPERLKKLHALTFESIHAIHPYLSGALIQSLSNAFKSTVRSLTFVSCWGHEGFFLAFMHAFPRIQDFQSIDGRILHQGPQEWQLELEAFKDAYLPFFATCIGQSGPRVPHPTLYLTSLRIDHHSFAQDALICLKSLRTVHTLEINHTGPRLHPIDDISNKILPECGRALRTLKLSITNLPQSTREFILFTSRHPISSDETPYRHERIRSSLDAWLHSSEVFAHSRAHHAAHQSSLCLLSPGHVPKLVHKTHNPNPAHHTTST